MTMPRRLTAAALGSILAPGRTVFVEAATAEPLELAAMLAAEPELTRGVRFVGCPLPGINRFAWARHPEAVAEVFFPIAEGGAGAGRQVLRPLHYTDIYAYLRDVCPVDVAFLRLAPPDAAGNCSLGIVADFAPAILAKARLIVAEIATSMPSPPNGPSIPYDRIDWVLETDRPVPAFPPEGRDGAAMAAIARHAASLIRDGDTLQIGIGRVQGAILGALGSHRRLALHSGLLSDAVLDLVEAGAMTRPMTAGVAIGTRRLYDWLAHARQVTFAPVAVTHGTTSIAAVESFLSINSALEIDLLGQVNAETANGRRVSSVGGLVDYMRGARASPGGRSIIALPATARGVSRIVPRLGAPASAARADVDYVVTEHGVAALRYATSEERAEALIAIADPAARPALEAAWRDMR